MTDQTAHGAVKVEGDDILSQAMGRARFLRNRGEIKTPDIIERLIDKIGLLNMEASLSPTTLDAVRGEVEPVAWQFQLAHSRDVNGEYFGWGPMRVAFEKPCVPEGSIRKLQPLYSATLHPSPEDPIGGQDVEAVAKIIHDECEDDDDSCGGAYMRAAKRILAALRAPVERKGEG